MKFQNFNSSGILSFNQFTYTDFNFCTHFHKNIEFVYVADGELDITVNNTHINAQKGDFAVILPYHVHSFKTETASKAVVGVFSNDFVGKFLADINHRTTSQFVFRTDENTAESFCNIKNFNTFRIMGVLYTICGFLLQQAEFTEYDDETDFTLKRILSYISNNFSDNITLQKIADVLGYEKHYVSKLFNLGAGMSLRKFINMCRIENARDMLDSSDKNISEIASECGFAEIRTFNRAFREYCGCSANEYRKRRGCHYNC